MSKTYKDSIAVRLSQAACMRRRAEQTSGEQRARYVVRHGEYMDAVRVIGSNEKEQQS